MCNLYKVDLDCLPYDVPECNKTGVIKVDFSKECKISGESIISVVIHYYVL